MNRLVPFQGHGKPAGVRRELQALEWQRLQSAKVLCQGLRWGSTGAFSGEVCDFSERDVGENFQLVFQAASEIRIVGKPADHGSYLGPEPGCSGKDARDIVIYVNGIKGASGNLVDPYLSAICPGVFSPVSASSATCNFTFGESRFLAMASVSLRHSPGRSPPRLPIVNPTLLACPTFGGHNPSPTRGMPRQVYLLQPGGLVPGLRPRC